MASPDGAQPADAGQAPPAAQAQQAPQDAPPAAPRRRRQRRAVPGLRTESDSGSEGDAAAVAAALAAAPSAVELPPADEGAPPLSRGALASRRLARTRAALEVYRRVHWRLLERLRERHRRFVVRAGHIGTKEGAHAAAARRAALRQAPAAPCAAPGCVGEAIALCTHCFAHVFLEPGQQLYRADESGAPRLWTPADGVPEPPPEPPAAAAAEEPQEAPPAEGEAAAPQEAAAPEPMAA